MRSKIILTLITMLSMFSGVRAQSSSDKIGNTIVKEIQEFIEFIMDMINGYIIEPVMRIFKNLFGGVADSIGSVGTSMFSGARGMMDTAWQELADFLGFLGPLAPIVASAMVMSVVVLVLWFVIDVIADMIFPKPFEKETED